MTASTTSTAAPRSSTTDATTSIFDSDLPSRALTENTHANSHAHIHIHAHFLFLSVCLRSSCRPVAAPGETLRRDDAAADGRRLTATISCAAFRSSSRGCRRRRMPRQEPAVLCHMFRDGHLSRQSLPLRRNPSCPRCVLAGTARGCSPWTPQTSITFFKTENID